MTKLQFPKGFLWGSATASYQIEGAAEKDGRGESIWDRFSHTPGKVLGGDTGDIACDHYHRYPEDIRMMKELGLKSYRFSIAWPRIYPQGKGSINQKGLDFYNRVVDELLEQGIEPAVTLYHWDLPQALQDKGGWENRETIDHFTEYAATMYRALGDRVQNWITHNEPWVVAFVGNAFGEHAPGKRDFSTALQVAHNVLVSHAQAVKAYRSLGQKGHIGITLNLSPAYPATENADDKAAAHAYDGFFNRWFLDPVFKGKYPEDMMAAYRERGIAPTIAPGDMDAIKAAAIDFLGINYYSRAVVKKGDAASGLPFEGVRIEDAEYTEMDWEVYPEGLHDLLLRLHKDYDSPDIYVTENGAAYKDDKVVDGRVEDDDRLCYLRRHFEQSHRAITAGVNLKGYYVWSLMDNFEWAFGYSRRFGIVYVNYETQERVLKKSALWYRDMIAQNGF